MVSRMDCGQGGMGLGYSKLNKYMTILLKMVKLQNGILIKNVGTKKELNANAVQVGGMTAKSINRTNFILIFLL